MPSLVSIAFRLSDELGLNDENGKLVPPELLSQLPFGFRTNWDHTDWRPEFGGEIKSQLPFGFRTNWDVDEATQMTVEARDQSQLPFGFRTNWDSPVAHAAGRSPQFRGLNCLSAFGRIGTLNNEYIFYNGMNTGLNCLSAFGRIGTSSSPLSQSSAPLRCLNCLSAFGRIGTIKWRDWVETTYPHESQLPFGFRTNWDRRLQVPHSRGLV